MSPASRAICKKGAARLLRRRQGGAAEELDDDVSLMGAHFTFDIKALLSETVKTAKRFMQYP